MFPTNTTVNTGFVVVVVAGVVVVVEQAADAAFGATPVRANVPTVKTNTKIKVRAFENLTTATPPIMSTAESRVRRVVLEPVEARGIHAVANMVER